MRQRSFFPFQFPGTRGWIRVWVFLTLTALAGGCGMLFSPRPFDDAAWMESQERLPREQLYAPHFADGRFFNPWLISTNSFSTFLRWKFSRPARRYDASTENAGERTPNDGAYLTQPGQPASITVVGHATFAIQIADQVWVTDPMWSRRALLPKRAVEPGIPVGALPDNVFAVVSHNHYDHLDAPTLKAMPAGTRWFVPLGLKEFFQQRGIERVREMDWWEKATVGETTLICLPAQHWSNRVFTPRDATLWAAWLLITPNAKIFFGGDSGYFHGFEEIGRRYGPIDEAILPIGAYEPRWFIAYSHMNIEEVLRAFSALRAKRMIPMQYGVFKLGEEPVNLPAHELRQALAGRPDLSGKVIIPAVGERIFLNGPSTPEGP